MEMRIAPPQLRLKLSASGLSDPGLVRKNNEDVWGCLPEHHLYLLADGMGGHQAGEVAARETVIHVCSLMRAYFEKNALKELTPSDVASFIRSAIEETNHFVYELGQTDELLYGMGTTLILLCFFQGNVIAAHVGDSRIYRLRDSSLLQVTQDHSLLRELIDAGKLASQQAGEFPYKNILTRAVGSGTVVEPTLCMSAVRSGDLYLLCSDGLCDLLNQQEIEDILKKSLSIEEKVRYLIAAAKHKGGYDNITVVLIEVIETSTYENIS